MCVFICVLNNFHCFSVFSLRCAQKDRLSSSCIATVGPNDNKKRIPNPLNRSVVVSKQEIQEEDLRRQQIQKKEIVGLIPIGVAQKHEELNDLNNSNESNDLNNSLYNAPVKAPTQTNRCSNIHTKQIVEIAQQNREEHKDELLKNKITKITVTVFVLLIVSFCVFKILN